MIMVRRYSNKSATVTLTQDVSKQAKLLYEVGKMKQIMHHVMTLHKRDLSIDLKDSMFKIALQMHRIIISRELL